MDCNSTGRSLKLARKLLGLPEPEIEPALPYLLDALRDTDLRTRETASDSLATLGRLAVPALVEAWPRADGEFRKLLTVTLGKIGPAAAAAVPLLVSVPDDHFLAPLAAQALARIQPPLLGDVLAVARSPWTWSGLIDGVLFIVSHPVTAVLSFFSAILSVIHWHAALAQADGKIVPAVEAAFALLGFYLGAVLGARIGGLATAKSLGKVGGMVGATAGLFIGGVAAALVAPLATVLRSP